MGKEIQLQNYTYNPPETGTELEKHLLSLNPPWDPSAQRVGGARGGETGVDAAAVPTDVHSLRMENLQSFPTWRSLLWRFSSSACSLFWLPHTWLCTWVAAFVENPKDCTFSVVLQAQRRQLGQNKIWDVSHLKLALGLAEVKLRIQSDSSLVFLLGNVVSSMWKHLQGSVLSPEHPQEESPAIKLRL